MTRASSIRHTRRPVAVGLRLNASKTARKTKVKPVSLHGKRLHPHKGYHGPRRHGYHISAEALARRIGKKHPHRGYHGPRRHHHISAEALTRRIGKKHPHRGHPMSAAARAKISAALRGRHHPRRKG